MLSTLLEKLGLKAATTGPAFAGVNPVYFTSVYEVELGRWAFSWRTSDHSKGAVMEYDTREDAIIACRFWTTKTDVEEVYTYGQCHALALVLHEEAGLPLVGLWLAGHWFEDAEYNTTPDHVVVELPDGDLLDIGGPGAILRYRGGRTEGHPVTKAEVLGYQHRDYMEPNLEAARPFARTLLKKLGIAPFAIKENK
jgi:hypothetical protein